MLTNYNELVTNNGGRRPSGRTSCWSSRHSATDRPRRRRFQANPNFTSEEGESEAHTFHWLRNLASLGTVDTTVTANHPLAKVFVKNGTRTYVASNITNTRSR